ncbi:MAG: tRNA-(ms[2]io[6]A)-hydroxylase [Myxococcales bacterium]|nr:tRNA-(ms[2]io[6]A)-hydroxylase [Myxococcales bacterium]
MLNLAAPTDPAWTAKALAHLDEVLLGHAHCEQKAAGMAVRLLFRYPDHAFLLAPISELAREELAHFEAVLRLLERRGIPFRRQRPSPYAGRLRSHIRSAEPERLLDTLLCCALIEARSCERFKLLAEAVDDPELARFYDALLASEARHHRLYVDLAARLGPADGVRERLRALAEREAAILGEAPPLARMHS